MLELPESYTISGQIEKNLAGKTISYKEMCEQGGRDTEKDLFGQNGKYITQLSKNTLYEPCIKCGREIHKANFLGGTVYYCENCQKK